MAQDAPDFYRYIQPAKTILGPGQQRYMLAATDTVLADGGTMTQEITVTTGLDFNFAVIVASCEASCIQRLRIIKNAGLHLIKRFDMSTKLEFPAMAAYVIHAGETLKIEVTNNDTSDRVMSTGVAGTVVSVE